ncbi:transporter substrate-binding domain-containing protein [Vibrio pectenicida]|uniref:Transporter substrate-binding domain-containing protein n=1 Tax=Vibrio pectenicida TaxID=62763 RepID=A0A7Y4A263_9VIBR|nr:transporter substrate-binding domain-containing protein [Vibrio pectenicida]NOH73088.1 transporter substrate-binding domain-containing protein [Vibrio pectenicida]
MKIPFLRLLFTALLFSSAVLANTGDSVKVAMGDIYKGSTLERDLRIIYKAADIDVEFIYLPTERAIQAAASGQYDALDLRIDTLDEEETLVRVDVPIVVIDVYLLSINDDFYPSLDDVKDKTLVSILGARYSDIAKVYKKRHLVKSEKQAALMLISGRADLWLAPHRTYLKAKEEFPNIKIASPSVYKQYLYHYVHVSKSHLVERLEMSVKAFNQTRSVN